MSSTPFNPSLDPPTYYTNLYRTSFREALLSGTRKPLVLPWSIAGSFLVPVLYLCIPHRKRPWLYSLRWAVVVVMALLNAWVVLRGEGSENFVVGYSVALIAGWGTIWGTALVVFMRVQWDAARVQARRRRGAENEGEEEKKRRRKEAPDESVAAMMDEWEYFWEPYPEEAGLWQRLEWVVSLFLSFRGVGWNFAIPPVPHPPPSTDPHAHPLVNFSNLPVTTKYGHRRFVTYRSFILSRLRNILFAWIALDFWTLTARYDPYFVPGPIIPFTPFFSSPSSSSPLPYPVPPILLPFTRSLLALLGVLSALHFYLPLVQLISAHNPLIHPSQRALFLYPSPSGSPLPILTHGLSAFWSSTWHQSFRLGFVAPTTYLIHHKILPPRSTTTKITSLFISFLLSGLMHALCGVTSLPSTTSFSHPILFFLLQFLGIIIQDLVGRLLARYISFPPRWKAAGNVIYTLTWLHLTNKFLIEDMSHAALWLFEPVPFSPLRMMGFGQAGEKWWRWDRTYIPLFGRWGAQWWEVGVRL